MVSGCAGDQAGAINAEGEGALVEVPG